MLDPDARKMFDHRFPGLLDAVRTLAPGEFIRDYDDTRLGRDGKGKLVDVAFGFSYAITSDKMLVRIRNSFSLEPGGTWKRYHYAHHCGSDPNNPYRAPHFRIDLDERNAHHVHLPPFLPPHVPAAEIDPNVFDINPFHFLELVREFRRTRLPPLVRKKP